MFTLNFPVLKIKASYLAIVLLKTSDGGFVWVLRMHSHGQKQWKTFKNHRKSTFSIMHTRGSWRKTKKKVCWLAIGSDSQKLVDTQKLVAHLEFCCFLIVFLHDLLMFMNTNHFPMLLSFSTMQMHTQVCVRWSKYTTHEYGPIKDHPGNLTIFCHNTLPATA